MTSVHGETVVYDVDDSEPVEVATPSSARKGLHLLNETGGLLYVLMNDDPAADAVSASFKSFILSDAQTYEMLGDSLYDGPVTCIAATGGTGRVSVTEFNG